jgi:hypothetical protein
MAEVEQRAAILWLGTIVRDSLDNFNKFFIKNLVQVIAHASTGFNQGCR